MRLIEHDHFILPTTLAFEIGLRVHFRTITNWLKEQGIQHQRALRRPKLTKAYAEKRLAFALKHIDKPNTYRQRWVFSDELTIAREDGESTGWVFCGKVGYFIYKYFN
jgi:nicotinamide mononucleotide adenylyltransferase